MKYNSVEIQKLETVTPEQYTEMSLETEAIKFDEIRERAQNPDVIRQLEFLMDQQMRVGNALDKLKKHIFYGKEFSLMPIVVPDINIEQAQEAFEDNSNIRLMHAAVGMATEMPEIFEHLYNLLYSGTPINKPKLAEEFGDNQWYAYVGVDALGMNMGKVMVTNAAKLHFRYDKGFSNEAAIERNLQGEDKILGAAT